LLVRDRSANLVGPRGLRGVRRRGARRRAASRRLRLAGRAATRRRAGALAGAGLGVALGADGRALLVALVVFLIARLGRLVALVAGHRLLVLVAALRPGTGPVLPRALCLLGRPASHRDPCVLA